MKKFINPYKLKSDDMPLIVFVDNANNFISWAIKWHTSGIYNHAMAMVNPGEFVSQDPTGLNRVPLDKYVRKGCKLKFVSLSVGQELKNKVVREMVKDAELPWYKTMYDFLGILGQFLRIKKIQKPYKYYCSERIIKYLKIVDPGIKVGYSPEKLNEYMKTKPSIYELKGYWFKD
jgi:hypothetical protein